MSDEIEEIKQGNEAKADLERGRLANQDLILFADDFYICHHALQLQLEALDRQDIKLEMFINGKELINRLQVVLDKIEPKKLNMEIEVLQPVKLVICDLNMPVMNGWQTLERMQELYLKK